MGCRRARTAPRNKRDVGAPDTHAISGAGIVRQRRWIPSEAGFVKVNVDAGVSLDHNLGTAAARYGVSLPQGSHLWLGTPHDPAIIPVNIVIHQ